METYPEHDIQQQNYTNTNLYMYNSTVDAREPWTKLAVWAILYVGIIPQGYTQELSILPHSRTADQVLTTSSRDTCFYKHFWGLCYFLPEVPPQENGRLHALIVPRELPATTSQSVVT
jgi:hypothetical protein